MTNLEWAGWSALVLLGFTGSALYSGLETGVYSLNRVRLHVLAQQGLRRAQRLHHEIADTTRLLSTLLIGNNIANQIGTAGLAVMLTAMEFGPWQAIILNTVIITPLLFVFGETLPKDFFAAFADRAMYRLTGALKLSRIVFTAIGLVPAIGLFNRAIMALMRTGGEGGIRGSQARRQVELLVREGVGYGLLSDQQSAIVGRVLQLGERKVSGSMTPWRDVVKIRETDSPSAVRRLAADRSRSRYVVVDRSGQVVGVINVLDVLLHDPQDCPPIRELMRAPLRLSDSLPLREALTQLQRQRESLAVVVGSRQQPVGVVSIKDLVEPITGEISAW